MYKCNRCKKQFKFLSYLTRHQNNKKQCKEIIEDVLEDCLNNDELQLRTDMRNMINSIINKYTIEQIKVLRDIVNMIDSEINKNTNDKLNKVEEITYSSSKNICVCCKKQFSCRQSLSRHKLKNRCKIINEDTIHNSTKNICAYCKKQFSCRQSLSRHKLKNKCKIKLYYNKKY